MPTNIKPIYYPNKGTANKIEITVLSFKTDDKNCTTLWELKSDDDVVLDSGNYELTEQEYDKWGSDNSFIVQCVINSLPDTELLN